MSELDVSICGFGDNVVDVYEHVRTEYPGGNCVNFAVYGKKAGVRRAAYMGYFGSDDRAERVIQALHEEGVETVKCRQLLGENGYSCVSIAPDGDRVWGDYNQGGIRGETSYVLDRFDIEYLRQFDVVHSGNYCYTERQLHKIHELGPRWVSATRGVEGCYAFDGERYYRQESTPVERMADAMGAGDSFLTSFLVKSIDCRKRGASDQEAYAEGLRYASWFASNVCCAQDGSWGHGYRY